jgi:hypothetical protein
MSETSEPSASPRTEPIPGRVPLSVAHVIAWVCLAVPFVALLWVSSYAKDHPSLWGFPFFFWYQFLWVLITAALTWAAYLLYAGATARHRRRTRAQHAGGPR